MKLREGEWRGESVAVVGLGPSVKTIDLEALVGDVDRVIAVNLAGQMLVDGVDLYFSAHPGFFFAEGRHIARRAADRCVAAATGFAEVPIGVEVVNLQPMRGGDWGRWPIDLEEGLAAGGCSGAGAVCLADLLLDGDGVIYLAGFDLSTGWHRYFRAPFAAMRTEIRSDVYVLGDSELGPEWRRSDRWALARGVR